MRIKPLRRKRAGCHNICSSCRAQQPAPALAPVCTNRPRNGHPKHSHETGEMGGSRPFPGRCFVLQQRSPHAGQKRTSHKGPEDASPITVYSLFLTFFFLFKQTKRGHFDSGPLPKEAQPAVPCPSPLQHSGDRDASRCVCRACRKKLHKMLVCGSPG